MKVDSELDKRGVYRVDAQGDPSSRWSAISSNQTVSASHQVK